MAGPRRESTRRSNGAWVPDRAHTAIAGPRDEASMVIAVRGRVALPEARQLEARALEAVRAGQRRIAVDLTEANAIEARLIGALLRIRRGLTRIDGELTLIIDGPPARDLVRTTGLDTLPRITSTPATRSSDPGTRVHPRL